MMLLKWIGITTGTIILLIWIGIIAVLLFVVQRCERLQQQTQLMQETQNNFLYEDQLLRNSLKQMISIVNTHLDQIEEATYEEAVAFIQCANNLREQAEFYIFQMQKHLGKKEFSSDLEKMERLIDSVRSCSLSLSRRIENLQEEIKQNHRRKQYNKRRTILETKQAEPGFFSDCSTLQEVTRRYRKLAKKYHPDNGGDKKIFVELLKEYQKETKRYENTSASANK